MLLHCLCHVTPLSVSCYSAIYAMLLHCLCHVTPLSVSCYSAIYAMLFHHLCRVYQIDESCGLDPALYKNWVFYLAGVHEEVSASAGEDAGGGPESQRQHKGHREVAAVQVLRQRGQSLVTHLWGSVRGGGV